MSKPDYPDMIISIVVGYSEVVDLESTVTTVIIYQAYIYQEDGLRDIEPGDQSSQQLQNEFFQQLK